jgi:hypothetical protein
MASRISHFARFPKVVTLAVASLFIFSSRSGAPTPAARHGLTGNYYVGSGGWTKDTPPNIVGFYQIWSDPNDFMLPRTFTAPATTRVDAQIAFGQGKGFNAKSGGLPTIWWPTGFATPPGWGPVAPTDKPWDQLAAVIWKGYIHFPTAGTYYFGTISNGASAVYLNQARVALNGIYGGVLVSDAFAYAKENVEDYVQKLSQSYLFAPRPGDTYVLSVSVDAPRDFPIEVRYNPTWHFTHWPSEPFGVDLFWVTPDSPRDDKGKPIASIVPSNALYTDPPGPIEKSVVRSANSTIAADHLYFPVQGVEGAVTLTIRLADKDGNPMLDKRVLVTSLNGWNADTIVQPDKPTDKNGETIAKIRANAAYPVAHESTILATDLTDFVDAAQVAHVIFQQTSDIFFDDPYSAYYDPRFSVTPLPPVVGRPATVKTHVKNRSEFPAVLTVKFLTTDYNIGLANWVEIARVEDLKLQPGETRDVSTIFTPKEVMGHKCYRVEVEGRFIAMNPSGAKVFAASLLPLPASGLPTVPNPPEKPATNSQQINTSTVAPGCHPDEGKRCQAIGKAIATIAAARQAIGSASLYQDLQHNLGLQLDQLRPELCDNPAAQSRLDEIRRILDSLNYVEGASNLANNLALLRIEDGLRQLDQSVCHVTPPSEAGPCGPGEKKVEPQDKEAAKYIKEKFKEAYDKAKETAREMQDHGATVPQQISDQVKYLKQAMEFWDNIQNAICINPNIFQSMQEVMRDRRASNFSSDCPGFCSALTDWYGKLVPGGGAIHDAMVKAFRDDCLARCE